MAFAPLIAFHFVYFMSFSVTNFLPRYFGEMGMADGQIGMLLSLSAIVGVIFQPFFGMLSDRMRYKRTVIIILLALLVVCCAIMDRLTSFWALLAGMSLLMTLQSPLAAVNSAVSLEYMAEKRRPYGPVRILGTVGYQVGALLPGAFLATRLTGLFRLLAVVMLLSLAAALMLPRVRGHQHAKEKVALGVLFRDKQFRAILLMVLIGMITTQYNNNFFARHMGNLGVSNSAIGWIFLLSVMMEIPLLWYADRLSRRVNVFTWFLVAYAINGVRWLGIALTRSVPLLCVLQLSEVSVLACFEYFPALYVSQHTPDALKGSAQMVLMLVSFGISKVIGGLLGGFVSEWVGIPFVYGFCGVMLLAAFFVSFRPMRRLSAEASL